MAVVSDCGKRVSNSTIDRLIIPSGTSVSQLFWNSIKYNKRRKELRIIFNSSECKFTSSYNFLVLPQWIQDLFGNAAHEYSFGVILVNHSNYPLYLARTGYGQGHSYWQLQSSSSIVLSSAKRVSIDVTINLI